MTRHQILLATVFSAMAIPSAAMAETSQIEPPTASAIVDGGFTLAPLSFVRFCMSNRDDCQTHGTDSVVTLTAETWQTLNEVNRAVNDRITPDPQADHAAWSLTADSGDCNDYAVQKRHELLAKGWPSAALSLAVVMTPDNKGHLVLSVRTDRGDMMLDNLHRTATAWDSADYRWVKRQSAERPQYWVEIKAREKSAAVTGDASRVAFVAQAGDQH